MIQLRPWLYIGNYRDTTDYALLQAKQITAMLQMAELVEQPGITALYLPVEDGESIPLNLIEQGLSFVREQHDLGNVLLIACGAGISRSATYVIGALRDIEGLDLQTAFKDVRTRHPDAMPHYTLWQSLCDYYKVDVPYIDLWQ